MKSTKHLIAAILAISSVGTALAADFQDGTDRAQPVTNSVTPAQVRAEFDAYRAAGVNPWSSNSYNPLKTFKSERTREEVMAEFRASRQEAQASSGEGLGAETYARAIKPSSTHFAKVN